MALVTSLLLLAAAALSIAEVLGLLIAAAFHHFGWVGDFSVLTAGVISGVLGMLAVGGIITLQDKNEDKEA